MKKTKLTSIKLLLIPTFVFLILGILVVIFSIWLGNLTSSSIYDVENMGFLLGGLIGIYIVLGTFLIVLLYFLAGVFVIVACIQGIMLFIANKFMMKKMLVVRILTSLCQIFNIIFSIFCLYFMFGSNSSFIIVDIIVFSLVFVPTILSIYLMYSNRKSD